MIPEYKISRYVALLISETKGNKVEWKENSHSVNSLEGEQCIVGKVYETSFKEKRLRLYKYSQPIQIGQFEYLRNIFFKLEFINEYDRNLWTFPAYIREIQDLYETVQIKLSELDKYFDEIIPNDEYEF